jgi:hypothetical protein
MKSVVDEQFGVHDALLNLAARVARDNGHVEHLQVAVRYLKRLPIAGHGRSELGSTDVLKHRIFFIPRSGYVFHSSISFIFYLE